MYLTLQYSCMKCRNGKQHMMERSLKTAKKITSSDRSYRPVPSMGTKKKKTTKKLTKMQEWHF